MIVNSRKYRYYLAIFVEFVAYAWLRVKGYNVLKWRYRARGGEIDMIACDGTTIVFVEVKFRKRKKDVMEALVSRQLNNIERASERFLQENPHLCKYDIRFDFIALYPFCLRHFHNAWQRSNFAS